MAGFTGPHGRVKKWELGKKGRCLPNGKVCTCKPKGGKKLGKNSEKTYERW